VAVLLSVLSGWLSLCVCVFVAVPQAPSSWFAIFAFCGIVLSCSSIESSSARTTCDCIVVGCTTNSSHQLPPPPHAFVCPYCFDAGAVWVQQCAPRLHLASAATCQHRPCICSICVRSYCFHTPPPATRCHLPPPPLPPPPPPPPPPISVFPQTFCLAGGGRLVGAARRPRGPRSKEDVCQLGGRALPS
jgi:hypothetical protein